MRPSLRWLTLLVLVGAASAQAVAKGGTLYVKSTDTALLKEPRAKAARVATLQPGTEVIWNGVSEKDKLFHEVSAGGKKGFVSRADLSPNKPQVELDASSGKPMSKAAFASSGAATKDGPLPRGKGSPAEETAAAELIYLEALNQQKATPAAVEAKSKSLQGR